MSQAKKEYKPRDVVATNTGYYAGKIREVGEVFSYTGPDGSWFEDYKAPPKAKAKPEPKPE